ncbi:aldo/keto reductase [Metabacillus sp. GX 13764]|uniref:aldo/keto reductase n=1 Tax=Metabacillus kandeliae TaxID=2900151 RepID=UPI001E2EC8F0|nr:aldo/keto reductase [Metabacillus kandeliae]MCD7034775.1 aldo/keto reductase [Metabacillus kandeliae]
MDNQALPFRKLGNSDVSISALGLGCWQFSKGNGMVGKFWPSMKQEDINEIIKICYEGGINWFDTAEAYGKGQSEEALGDALNELGAEDALVATKWWPLLRTAKNIPRTIDQRLQALKGRKIDLYQVHQPYSFSSAEKEMNAMADLLEEGKIGHAGVSNFNAASMRKAHEALQKRGFQLSSNQVKYSLLDRRIEENGILEAAREIGATIIAYSPLEQGILSGKFHRQPELLKNLSGPRKHFSQFKGKALAKSLPLIDLLEKLGEEYGVKPGQVALNWLIRYHGDTVVAIPGASKLRHAKENIGTLRFSLSDAHMEEIDAMSKKVTKG